MVNEIYLVTILYGVADGQAGAGRLVYYTHEKDKIGGQWYAKEVPPLKFDLLMGNWSLGHPQGDSVDFNNF